MTLRLGDTAPDFEQDSTIGRIRFHDWAGDSWVVLFSHPADFTPVCTTELGLTAKLKDPSSPAATSKPSPCRSTRSTRSTKPGSRTSTPPRRPWWASRSSPMPTARSVSQLYDMIHPNASGHGHRALAVRDRPGQESAPDHYLPR
jgi:hypothetical protein